jgi:Ca-activated chloride channel family protein
MRIFTVGVGTPGGELLRVQDENGKLNYLKDESGNVVKSRLNEQLLQQIATAANGFYLPLRGGNAMEILYQKGLAPLPTSDRSSKLMKRLKEQFYWPLGAAIVLLILEVFLPERKTVKRESATPASTMASTAALLFCLAFSVQLHASPAKALQNYKSGEYKSAYYEYKRLLEKNPADPRLHFNAGASAYQASKFDEAVKSFEAAVASPDPALQQQSYYNLGNSEFRLGESDSNPQQKMGLWEQALQHYDAALKINPSDNDAKFNKEVVQKRLEELKKQQQQDQKNKDKNKNEENKDQNKDQKDQQKNNEDQKKQNQEKQQQQKDKDQNNSQDQSQKDQQQDQEQQPKKQDKQDQAANDQQQQDQNKDKSQANQTKPGDEKQSDQGQNPEDAQAAQYAQLGKMTPAQAKQLLDAQKGDEKAMIFIPQQKKSSAQNRAFKDW